MLDRRAFLSGMMLLAAGCTSRRDDIVVGSKNFTEQLILGELVVQVLARTCQTIIDGRFYLAGTYICQQAILAGRIDIYPEYTGTALAAVLKEKATGDSHEVYEEVKRQYRSRFGLDVMPPLGFDNSFAMVMRGDDARRMGLTKLSQLEPVAPQLKLGVGYEFLERRDGYAGLVKTYDLEFAEAPRVMDLGLLYRALENRSVDIVAGSNTDGLIAALGLIVLEDDRHYFPPYDAVLIVRPEIVQRCPKARSALESLSGRITAADMRQMNYQVDGQKRDAGEVAAEFLNQRLISTTVPLRRSLLKTPPKG
ncbi:MAG TPA: glycine betaine ABC transporter substrate-binding protein [Candidatus Limnocylindrales bacterium]|nr:glycine betaine ABC transporter substrate-binding protein [Candidatus Limnocylindrales bacterium]